MTEPEALRVIAARAIETHDSAREVWSDDDRAWASRAAAEVVGADAPPATFVARRADLVLERVGAAHPGVMRSVRAVRWRPWIGGLLAGAAFVLGFFVDQVDRSQRINILAPPVLLLLLWNLGVYAVMLLSYVVHFGEGEHDGWLRALVARLLGGRAPGRAGAGPLRGAVTTFIGDWSLRSAPLQQARAARVLHVCAAALAAGVLAGLYLRGLAFEYLASWQSTFLDASTVRRIAAVAYAPGNWLTRIGVPPAEAIEAMRAPNGVNAAPWIHLMAASVALVVIVPRLVLALVARMREGWLAGRLLPSLDEPYFQRVLRGFAGGPQRVRVVPFSVTLDAASLDGIEAIVARAFAPNATLIFAPTVRYGDEAATLASVPAGTATLVVFDAAATPEREVHGAFLLALRASAPTLLALVDEGAWRAHWRDEPSRVTEREANWQRLGEETGVAMVFVDLDAPDLAHLEHAIDAALEGGASRVTEAPGSAIAQDVATLALSLISHTNTGKTTLARTLLGRDVGDVRDAQHVTAQASAYPLIESPAGDALVLWDTPGFGDSARLARRLAQQGNPVGWFLTQVWDRFRDPALHLAQHAVRNVRDHADVLLYLVNAAESPQDAGYLAAELDILAFIGKPTLVLLNQVGAPRTRDEDAADEARWREAIGARPFVRAVATLDAFTRCWVQELALLDLVAQVVPRERNAAALRLSAAWLARRVEQFDASVAALAAPIALAACDQEPLPASTDGGVLREIGRLLGIGADKADSAKARAGEALAHRLDDSLRAGTDTLIALHGLDGHAKGDVLARLAAGATLDKPMSEGKAAAMGGAVSGALTGLAADLAAGGLTFGAGLVTGALIGALGGAGVARGMNLARGKTGTVLRFDDAFLTGLVRAALLRYLAIAHYGRGRGAWSEGEYPAFWPAEVDEVLRTRADRLAMLWAARGPGCTREDIEPALAAFIGEAAWATLDRLYPGTLPSRA